MKEFKELGDLEVSHESIYYYIYEKSEKYKQLYKHLRTNRPKRIKQGKRKNRNITIKNRVSIHERPKLINDKKRIGDWESNTVEFVKNKNNPYLSVQFERKSQLARIHKLRNKTAEETKKALIKTANSVEKEMFKSITFDNGLEGSKHYEVGRMFNIETFFCDS